MTFISSIIKQIEMSDIMNIKELPRVLRQDYYLGFEYIILLEPYGYPTAYIKLNNNSKYYAMSCDKLNIIVNLGNIDITYSKGYLMKSTSISTDGWWIGWDYGHFGDYSYNNPSGKIHPIEEVLTDVFKTINKIK